MLFMTVLYREDRDMKSKINHLDMELLRLLLEDSRQSYIQLAKKLDIHKDTVRRRVLTLQNSGIITRFTILIDHGKLMEFYPTLWKVLFSVKALRDHTALVQELLQHPQVIEVYEATPSAVHNIVIVTQFKNLVAFSAFSEWLKRKPNIDAAQIDVTPIYKQHSRRRRLVTAIEDADKEL
jgi:DNA-binding Lrp family transcriptional regulator